jgi:ubiquitin carboxyl-terminal hydrolase L3
MKIKNKHISKFNILFYFMETKEVFNWPPLESDPEIFTNYMSKLGLGNDYKFDEVFSLDDEVVSMFQESNPFAVIVNYERSIVPKKISSDTTNVPFFMLQNGKLDNACGVIAALHSVGNNLNKIKLDEDSILSSFFTENKNKSPEEISISLQSNTKFQDCHKDYSNQGQSNLCSNQNEVKNHFVSFVLINGNIVELDGVIGKPLVIEKNVNENELLVKVVKEIKQRLADNNITESLNVMILNSF